MRIRTIKPSIHKDDELWDLEQSTGLPIFRAFTGLWSAADREGRFEWRPRMLKTDILPYWDGDFSRVLDALVTRGFVVKYASHGRAYGLVRTFKRHQVVNNREQASVLPSPPENPENPQSPTRGPRVLDASATRHDPAHGEQEQEQEQEQERERARAPEVLRFRRPVGEAPQGTEVSDGQSQPWLVVWRLYETIEGKIGACGAPVRFRDALQAIAGAAEVESGHREGVEFENAVQRLLGAWKADRYVRDKQPSIKNLADNLHRYSRPKTVVKAAAYEESREERWIRENREAEERHQESLRNPGEWTLKVQALMAARAAKESAS